MSTNEKSSNQAEMRGAVNERRLFDRPTDFNNGPSWELYLSEEYRNPPPCSPEFEPMQDPALPKLPVNKRNDRQVES